ncbi:hypothetical protein CAEBREN_17738 [Caenorhabditis brenneri]|uniref:GH18 domain-containing protein n=1 Tax=Caenorhabditis brenneri TaxID=135651 RepID=G0NF21_CAEBE|nr:hypothetical protein CAEBREN_17738 [Caenorhabditis brenneri]
MSCYTPLLSGIKEKSRSTVTICNVLLTLFGFFLLFFWFYIVMGKQTSEELDFVPILQPSEDMIAYNALDKLRLTAIKESEELRKNENQSDEVATTTTEEPKTETAATLFPAKTTTCDPATCNSAPCGKRIVGYYNGWNNQKLSENQFLKITHLVFAFMKINENGTISFENEEKKSLFLEMKEKAKEVNPSIKVMFSIGGLYNSEHFSKLVGNFKKRENFTTSIASCLEQYQFDGVDVFWKWPETKDKAHYIFFLRELRQKLQNLQNSGLLSIVTTSVGFELMDGFHLNGILKHVDFINVETDKMNGKHGQFTGAPSPLFSEIGEYEEFNVDWTMRHVACTTGRPNQINMGVPFYGRYWKGVQDSVEKGDEMWRTVETTGKSGVVFWRNLESEGFKKDESTWHQESKTPFIWDSKDRLFLGYENEKSLKEKMQYTIEHNLGGLTIWTLEMDDDVNSLLKAVTENVECRGEEVNKNDVLYKCEN